MSCSGNANEANVSAMETLLKDFESLTINCVDDDMVDEVDESGAVRGFSSVIFCLRCERGPCLTSVISCLNKY